MVEVSVLLLTLMGEGFVVLLAIILVGLIMIFRAKKRDKNAARKLVDQVRKQSQTRLETTGSFLNEKYRFEGNELKKAVKSIDKAEKKFIQKFINIYLKRDAEKLISMDATVAEMIDTYKSLSPVMPDAAASTANDSSANDELEALREANNKLTEELAITKETMANMIGEFGNMFGGGQDHELAKHEVVDKVKETKPLETIFDDSSDDGNMELENGQTDDEDNELSEEIEIDVSAEVENNESEQQDDKIALDEEVAADDEVDDLLESIGLSDQEKK